MQKQNSGVDLLQKPRVVRLKNGSYLHVCPRCGSMVDSRDKKCDCGQFLDWSNWNRKRDYKADAKTNKNGCIHYAVCFVKSNVGCSKSCKYYLGNCDNCYYHDVVETESGSFDMCHFKVTHTASGHCGNWRKKDD